MIDTGAGTAENYPVFSVAGGRARNQNFTLDGGNSVQILKYYSANFQALETRVTLQHLTLVNAKTTPTKLWAAFVLSGVGK